MFGIMRAMKQELQEIPGIGPRIAELLAGAGVERVADLKGADAEALYGQLCNVHGQKFDRCLLYVLRCAIYYASTPSPRPHLLKWWNWQDASASTASAR